MTLNEIKRRGQQARLAYWMDYALRAGAFQREAVKIAEALERQMQEGRAPTLADQARVLNWYLRRIA